MRLCRLDDVVERGSLGFSIEVAGKTVDGFVVYRDGAVTAFLNSCPHRGAPLNWSPDVFLSPEGEHIQCALHGALFRISDGFCEYGPCAGDSLTPLAVASEGESVVLLAQDVPLTP